MPLDSLPWDKVSGLPPSLQVLATVLILGMWALLAFKAWQAKTANADSGVPIRTLEEATTRGVKALEKLVDHASDIVDMSATYPTIQAMIEADSQSRHETIARIDRVLAEMKSDTLRLGVRIDGLAERLSRLEGAAGQHRPRGR